MVGEGEILHLSILNYFKLFSGGGGGGGGGEIIVKGGSIDPGKAWGSY